MNSGYRLKEQKDAQRPRARRAARDDLRAHRRPCGYEPARPGSRARDIPGRTDERCRTAAGLAASCGVDPTPVRAAFTVYLDHRHSRADERQSLWQHLSLVERSSIGNFSEATSRCASVQTIVLRAVRRLEEASR